MGKKVRASLKEQIEKGLKKALELEKVKVKKVDIQVPIDEVEDDVNEYIGEFKFSLELEGSIYSDGSVALNFGGVDFVIDVRNGEILDVYCR